MRKSFKDLKEKFIEKTKGPLKIAARYAFLFAGITPFHNWSEAPFYIFSFFVLFIILSIARLYVHFFVNGSPTFPKNNYPTDFPDVLPNSKLGLRIKRNRTDPNYPKRREKENYYGNKTNLNWYHYIEAPYLKNFPNFIHWEFIKNFKKPYTYCTYVNYLIDIGRISREFEYYYIKDKDIDLADYLPRKGPDGNIITTNVDSLIIEALSQIIARNIIKSPPKSIYPLESELNQPYKLYIGFCIENRSYGLKFLPAITFYPTTSFEELTAIVRRKLQFFFFLQGYPRPFVFIIKKNLLWRLLALYVESPNSLVQPEKKVKVKTNQLEDLLPQYKKHSLHYTDYVCFFFLLSLYAVIGFITYIIQFSLLSSIM